MITIQDDGDAGTLGFDVSSTSVNEVDETVAITVSREGDNASGEVSVRVVSGAVSGAALAATPGVDFEAVDRYVLIATLSR